MTERAAGTAEQVSPYSNGLAPPWPIGRRHRCCEEAREEGKLFDRTDRIKGLLAVSLGHVVGNSIVLASRGFIPLGLKELVGDTHLDVVRLAGEQQERLVLGLPAKTSDRAVIAVVVRLAGDRMAGEDDIRPTVNPERSLHGGVIGLVGKDHLVRDLFDQACAKDRSGNPEDQVAACELLLEIGLNELAALRS